MRIQPCKCEVCGTRFNYEHGGDKGYSYDPPLCGPHCGGVRGGRAESATKIQALTDALRLAVAENEAWRKLKLAERARQKNHHAKHLTHALHEARAKAENTCEATDANATIAAVRKEIAP